ncbi:MAG: hypothetical protein S0880_10790 [Actinomycetota bacterium]|nr:hypothetical protein [Actinomycetota bacterium]
MSEDGIHPAAAASNWRRVLLVDASIGVAVIVAGFVVGVVTVPVLGAVVAALGVAYVVAVARRAREWAGARRRHGLDG